LRPWPQEGPFTNPEAVVWFEEENAAWDRRIRELLDELKRVTQEIAETEQTKRTPF